MKIITWSAALLAAVALTGCGGGGGGGGTPTQGMPNQGGVPTQQTPTTSQPSQEQINIRLRNAAYEGDLARVRQQLNAGAEINGRSNSGLTALHYAASVGHANIVRTLIAAGANVNALNSDRDTPLHLAASGQGPNSNIDVIRLLVNAGANVNARNNNGFTPENYAIGAGNCPRTGCETGPLQILDSPNSGGSRPDRKEIAPTGDNQGNDNNQTCPAGQTGTPPNCEPDTSENTALTLE